MFFSNTSPSKFESLWTKPQSHLVPRWEFRRHLEEQEAGEGGVGKKNTKKEWRKWREEGSGQEKRELGPDPQRSHASLRQSAFLLFSNFRDGQSRLWAQKALLVDTAGSVASVRADGGYSQYKDKWSLRTILVCESQGVSVSLRSSLLYRPEGRVLALTEWGRNAGIPPPQGRSFLRWIFLPSPWSLNFL